tara:strand:- start:7814 stop:9058 length:1245 start_codon:yes stop_codon:yes gene_type:complete
MFLIENIKRAFFPFYKAEKTKKIFKILNKDKKKQAMFVGGCVRKYLTKDNVDDIDIATTLTPEEIIAKFSNSDFEIKKTGIEHGTLTLVINKQAFEVTTLREDVSTDGRHAKISFTEDWKKDSERRDFTINAIYLDEFGNVYDPQFGVKDLKNKKIRFIGDPNKRIKEDYLRILRYIRFSIQYKNYDHDDETSKAIKINLDGITKLSKERIYSELKKIIKLKNFSDILKSQFLLDIFKLIFPEIKYLERTKDLSKLYSSKKIKLDQDIIFSAILLDSSNNHEYFSHKYNVSNETKINLNLYAKLLKEIDSNKNFFRKDLRKNIFYHGREKIKTIFLIHNIINRKIITSKIFDFFKGVDEISIPKFPINGNYLLNHGIKSGKKIGELIKKFENQWIENDFNLDDEEIKTLIKKNI